MQFSDARRYLFVWFACLAFPVTGWCGDFAILSERTWDEYVPKGKEVDAIYGDFVLRNDKIVLVIANPIPGRNANMTVKDVGGSIIDLTVRDRQSDQLSAYYPGARRYPYRLAGIYLEGNVGTDPPAAIDTNSVSFAASDGKLGYPGSVLRGDLLRVELLAPGTADRPEVRLSYTIRNGSASVEVRSEFVNGSDKSLPIVLVDDFRADRTFTTHPPGETELAWFFDRWWGQAYGVAAMNAKPRLTGSPAEPRVIEFLVDGKPTIELAPGQKCELVRHLFSGDNLVNVKTAHSLLTNPQTQIVRHMLQITSPRGPVAGAEVTVMADDSPVGTGRTDSDGLVRFDLPSGHGKYDVGVSAIGIGAQPKALSLLSGVGENGAPELHHAVQLAAPARVVAEIVSAAGKPIPCKVQFIGIDGTQNPFFFEQTGEHAVHNLFYTHNGRFTQEIPPGKYDVLVSYGPEYNVERLKIEAKPGEDVPLKASLTRVVQSPGWVSADFHSHSSPSGDNTSSQLGRVLNLLCEHIEFAPCTEHNRLDSYVPHLKSLGIELLMGTCTGMELTHLPGTINHQNAFPLILKPRMQDSGAPWIDNDPAEQIKRLALWDNGSEKLVQSNHPDMGEMFFDRDGDGQPDGGYAGMFAFQDVIEVHPIHDVLAMNPLRYAEVEDKKTKVKTKYQYNNTIFNWLQLLNQGRRLPGVVNTDAHYNFHGSGGIRNYVKCPTDDPAKIDPIDIVRASEQGHIVMTNGPYLEVTLHEAAAAVRATPRTQRTATGRAHEPIQEKSRQKELALLDVRKAIPGDEFPLPGGYATLHVRVQCPNWFDIDRVQVILNGRPDPKLNWTRSANAAAFSGDVVKFDRKIPLEVKADTHVIVVATGEHSILAPVMGGPYGTHKPTAISNPIFIDADGGGFKANGDTLGHPLPVKQQRVVPQTTNAAR